MYVCMYVCMYVRMCVAECYCGWVSGVFVNEVGSQVNVRLCPWLWVGWDGGLSRLVGGSIVSARLAQPRSCLA